MAELLEALGQTLRRTPLRTAGALGLLVLVSAGSYAAARSGATESDCATASRALDGVWDEERREVLKTAFLATGVSFAEDAWQRVEGQLDAYSKVWVSAYQASCEEHAAGVQTSRLTDLRVACLGRHRSRLAALVEVFRGADRSVVENAVQAVAALPSVSACADSEALLAVPPPSDPQVVQRVEQLRLQLAQVEALELTGGFEQGLEQAKKVRDEAMALGYAPLKAEAALRLGNLLMAVGQSAEANEAFVDVIKQAIVHDLHALGGEAAAKQIYVLSQGLQKHAEALTIRTVAEALVERSNDDGRATALLHNNLGVVYTLLRELDSAQAHYERSIALLQARSGAQNPLIAAAYHNLGELNLKRGRLDVARESYTQALEHFTRILGATHPYVAHPIAGLGELALKEGAHDAALDSFTRALALMEAAYGLEHPYLIQPLIGLGAAHAARGQLAEARARYARAASIAERLGVVEAPQLGQALEGEAGAIVAENPREARVLFERAVQAYAAALGKDTAMQAPAAVRAGELAAQQGDAPAAVRWFELVLSLPADATVEWRSRAAVSLARALSVQPEATARICDLLAEAELSLADSDPLRSEARSLRADRCGGQPGRE